MAHKLGTIVYDATSLKRMKVKEVHFRTPLTPSDEPEIWYVLEDLEDPLQTYQRPAKAVAESEKALISKITEDLCKTIQDALKVKNNLVTYLAWLEDSDIKNAAQGAAPVLQESAPPQREKKKPFKKGSSPSLD